MQPQIKQKQKLTIFGNLLWYLYRFMRHTMSLNGDHCTAAQIIMGTTSTSSTYSTITSATRIRIGTTTCCSTSNSATQLMIGTSSCINWRRKLIKYIRNKNNNN